MPQRSRSRQEVVGDLLGGSGQGMGAGQGGRGGDAEGGGQDLGHAFTVVGDHHSMDPDLELEVVEAVGGGRPG